MKFQKPLMQSLMRGYIYLISIRYLYTVGLLSLQALANSLTFILPATNVG